jgi:hypothetical protein
MKEKPWTQHRRVKLLERLSNSEWAEKSDEFKALLIERARRDPVFFFNQFCFTYDPRPERKPHHFPFITYPFQDELIEKLEESVDILADLHLDKSRDMGASWVCLTWLVWKWWKNEPFSALVGSRKEDMVDNFQEDSLFGKIGYAIDALPKWAQPEGYRSDKHRRFLRIRNPANGNTIQGESANRDFSRQGRYTVIFLDEYAFWDHADSGWTATGDSSPVRVAISTPYGMNNKFADLKFHTDIRQLSLHWTLHPEKDEAWYEKEKLRRTAREVAQELDIDYEASGAERVFTLRTNPTLRDNVVIEPFEVPRDWNFRAGLDYGTRNKSSFHIYAADYDENYYSIWEWRKNTADLIEDGVKGSMIQAIAKMLVWECPYYSLIDHIRADPSMWVKNQNSEDEMKSLINLIYLEIEKEVEKFNRQRMNKSDPPAEVVGFVKGAQSDIAYIQVVKNLWATPETPQLKFFKNCDGQIKEFEELEWEDWSETQKTVRNVREKIKDRNNHSFDDSKYCLMSFFEKPEQKRRGKNWNSGSWFMEQMGRDDDSEDFIEVSE